MKSKAIIQVFNPLWVIVLSIILIVSCDKDKDPFPELPTGNIGGELTGIISLPFSDGFDYGNTVNTYDIPPDNWIEQVVSGFKEDRGWAYRSDRGVSSSGAMTASAYGGELGTDNTYLIAGPFDFDAYTNITLSLDVQSNYSGPGTFRVKYSTTYSGTDDPEASGISWTEITAITSQLPDTDQVWTSIKADLTSISGSKIFLAFHYKDGTDVSAKQWVLDNIVLTNLGDATLSTSVDSLPSFGSVNSDAISSEQFYEVSGTNLAGDLTVTAPQYFNVSENSGGPYSSSITLSASSVNAGPVKVYIVFEPQSYSSAKHTGNITHVSTGATTGNIFVSGDEVNTSTAYLSKDFEDDSISSGGWTTQVIVGTTDWVLGSVAGKYAKATNYNSGNSAAETWLISPAVDINTANTPMLTFTSTYQWSGPQLELFISTDYDGTSDPNNQGTWTNLSSVVSWDTNGSSWTFVSSGDIALDSYKSSTTYIAYKYTGSDSDGSTWEIDDILIRGN